MGKIARRGGGVMFKFDEHERRLLVDLIDSMLELLDDGGRDEPALKRLFPDAYTSAAEAAAWHDLVGEELHRNKVSSLRSVRETVTGSGQFKLKESEVQVWLSALNDVRLAIGARLEVTEEMMGTELADDDPRAPTLAVMHWLGWLQESMLRAIP